MNQIFGGVRIAVPSDEQGPMTALVAETFWKLNSRFRDALHRAEFSPPATPHLGDVGRTLLVGRSGRAQGFTGVKGHLPTVGGSSIGGRKVRWPHRRPRRPTHRVG